MKSALQFILQKLYIYLGNEPLSEHMLQCAPRWLPDEVMENEKKSYVEREPYEPIPVLSLP